MANVKPVKLGNNTRMSFSKINEVLDMPNLIEVQKNSYQWFLDEGLREVFQDVAAVQDYTGKLVLEFVDYRLDDTPKYTVEQCKERDVTYAAPLRVKARLLNKETGEIKESEVFMGDFPLMTESGTFVINGAERVIVSQLVRSPGVYYGMSYDTTGKKLYNATVIPNRGAWLEYETDSSDVFYVRIDKNRKIPVTVFVRALGLGSDAELLEFFGEDERIQATIEKDITKNTEEALLEVYRKLRPGEPLTVENSQQHLESLFFDDRRYDLSRVGRYKYNKKLGISNRLAGCRLSRPVVNPLTGEVMAEAGELLDRAKAVEIENAGVMVAYVTVEEHDGSVEVKVISNGMVDIRAFVNFDVEELGIREHVRFSVLREILEGAEDEEALKEAIRQRADELVPKHIIIDDILASINYLNCLAHDVGTTDDIDHLGNRRIRSVGELLQNQFRIGFSRMERVIRERMTLQAQDMDVITPQALINIRPVVAAIKEFFGSSPLSQFMDQTNPLAELTHKRRLSALGPGGLSRDRAGFEVRDVHYSHYGRMCPIETPEGPNIGLISYLATYARINEYGFVEAPFRKVDKDTGVVTDEVVYMPADVEDDFIVAQANEPLDEQGRFARTRVNARFRGEFLEIEPERIDYMDVSPKMMVSVATAMIPFLENDDANRALMGSNMQRQAVPLLKPQAPLVGTGLEARIAVDSRAVVVAKEAGIAAEVTGDHIIITADGLMPEETAYPDKVQVYKLYKFLRSNAGTCVNQRPTIVRGTKLEAGDVIADGAATEDGELALGRNVLVAFMPSTGYNIEDPKNHSERHLKDHQ